MSHPLNAELSEVDGAIYPPSTKDNILHFDAEETPVLRIDDDHGEEKDDSSSCGVGQIPAEAEDAKPEPIEALASSLTSFLGVGAPSVPLPSSASRVVAPPPSLPPPTTASGMPRWVTDDDPRVTRGEDGKWTAIIEVDPKLHGFLIGTRGVHSKEMELATQCHVIFPGRDSNSPLIRIVSALGAQNVALCLDRIEATLHSRSVKSGLNTNRKNGTHFAAIPCNDPWVRQRFLTFQDLMMTTEEVDPSCQVEALFPSKMKLHLTIGHLQLETDEEKELARKTMDMLKEKYAQRPPIEVHIDGFDVATEDQTAVHVLFAKVHGQGVQELIDDIRDELAKADLMTKVDKRSVRLQMPLMNSRYAATDENGNRSKFGNAASNRKTFNPSWIMREHSDFPFGSFTLNRFTICNVESEDETTGYYECFYDETLN
ncbi:hypothetical protein PENTCL1PPCAC_15222 [Pristionchus entomophagus]|uniref:K Homology domain-containing protein n=1 Tax=Pristionchus entomophagus TaxID=358040 RepID=A0AAV5TEQ1_9BILA|nr:hypothetical protein PENTCL1PPCAC_15222 [Pristionchus entomophagus]